MREERGGGGGGGGGGGEMGHILDDLFFPFGGCRCFGEHILYTNTSTQASKQARGNINLQLLWDCSDASHSLVKVVVVLYIILLLR